MVLDTQGGPNWFKNWCAAPILVDPDKDEVYLTPIYYTMSHFSRYIRPEAKRIGVKHANNKLMVTSVKNPDNSIVVVVFNEEAIAKNFNLKLKNKTINLKIDGQAIQTIVIPNL